MSHSEIKPVDCDKDSLLLVFQQIQAGDDEGAAASLERHREAVEAALRAVRA